MKKHAAIRLLLSLKKEKKKWKGRLTSVKTCPRWPHFQTLTDCVRSESESYDWLWPAEEGRSQQSGWEIKTWHRNMNVKETFGKLCEVFHDPKNKTCPRIQCWRRCEQIMADHTDSFLVLSCLTSLLDSNTSHNKEDSGIWYWLYFYFILSGEHIRGSP